MCTVNDYCYYLTLYLPLWLHISWEILLFFSNPGLPDVRGIAGDGLFAVSDDRLLEDLLLVQNFSKFLLFNQVLEQGQSLLVPGLVVNQPVQAANGVDDAGQLAFGETFLLSIDKLKLDPAFFEEALGLSGVRVFLAAKNLNVYACFPLSCILLICLGLS